MIYLKLFLSFIQIGLFSIGGGLAALPLIQDQVVSIHGWLTLSEFADIVSIAEMTPGPIAVNSATFVGIKIAGIPGAIIATLGCILPSCVIVLLLAYLYQKYKKLNMIQGILGGLRPAIIALIASSGLTILLLALFNSRTPAFENVNWVNVAIIVVGIFVSQRFNPNPILIIGGAGLIGLFLYLQSTLGGADRIWLYGVTLLLVAGLVAYRLFKRGRKETS